MKKILNLALLLAMLVALLPQAALGWTKPDPYTRVVYQANPRNHCSGGNLPSENEADGFVNLKNRLVSIKNMGFDVLYIMPVYKLGEQNKKGIFGSPYCIQDFKDVDPRLGTKEQLKELINAAHDLNMEVWFDWVANHTSQDHPWSKVANDQKEYYYYDRNGDGSIRTDWDDIYSLNHANADVRAEMADALCYWVREFDIDGFRCDYADGPHNRYNNFWREMMAAVAKEKAGITWVAEVTAMAGDASRRGTIDEGFDYAYFDINYSHISGWLNLAYKTNGSDWVNTIGDGLNRTHSSNAYQYGSAANGWRSKMFFINNHDIFQEHGTSTKLFRDNTKAMTVLTYTAYGMPMVHNGDEIAHDQDKVYVGDKIGINFDPGTTAASEMSALVTSLASLKHQSSVLRTDAKQGKLRTHSASNGNVYVFERYNDDGESLVVMLNFGSSDANDFTVGTLRTGQYQDWFNGSDEKTLSPSAQFSLPAHGYAVYANGTVEPTPKHKLFVKDNGSGFGNNLHVYGYSGETNQLFGAWPGATGTNSTIGGVTYKVFEFEESPLTYNLIFNNGNGGNGNQFDFKQTITGNQDWTVTINGNAGNGTAVAGAPSGTATPEPDPDPTPDPEPDPTGTYYIYFDNSNGWATTPHIWAWIDHGATLTTGDWPGPAMTNKGNNLWYYEFTQAPTNIIITDGKGKNDANKAGYNTTDTNLVFVNGYTYYSDGHSANVDHSTTPDPDPDPDPTPDPDPYYIYFDNSNGWATVPHIWAWNAAEQPVVEGSWPGPEMIQINRAGGMWYYEFTEAPKSFIITPGHTFEGYNPDNYKKEFTFTNGATYSTGSITSIADIDSAESEDAVYYNLQGVKIDNPQGGMFIKRQGNKVTKVAL